MNFYTGLEKDVSEEIRAWSLHALEKPNVDYNNFPVCPFAANAWQDDTVGMTFKYIGYPSKYLGLTTIDLF